MKYLYIFAALLIFIGCKTNQTVNGEREGLWIEKNKIGTTAYKSRGRYHKGFERKTWRYYENGKLTKKEVYKDSICQVTHFKNGKKSLEGTTKLRVTDTDMHWFYTGDWREYDLAGNLIFIRTYENGEMVSEVETVN